MSVDVEEALVGLLLANLDVAALAGDRVFFNRQTQITVKPAVILRRTGGGKIGNAAGYGGVSRAMFQVESWSAKSQEEARQLNLAVQEIKGTRGTVGDWWIQSLRLSPDTDQDNPQVPTHADDLGEFCSVSDFVVFYQRGT